MKNKPTSITVKHTANIKQIIDIKKKTPKKFRGLFRIIKINYLSMKFTINKMYVLSLTIRIYKYITLHPTTKTFIITHIHFS